MGDISFAQIPNNWLVPFVWCEFNSDNAVSGASVQPMKMLVVGQKLSDGSAPALTVKRVTSVEQGRALFGKGSMLARMISDVKNANKVTDLYAIAVDDAASGSAATATVTITGTAGESGTLCLYVGDYRVPVGVSKSNAAADIAQALAVAVSADGELPVTAACEAGVVTLTAKHKGECGNMPVHLNHYDGEILPAGLTVAVTDLTGGATNPDIGDVIAAIGDAHYNFIATPYTDAANLSALKTELESRWSALRAIEGVAFGALGGELSALGEKGAALNDKHLTLLNAHGLKSPLYAVAASYMATVALYASNDPAAPFRYALNGIMTGSAEEQFTDEERNLLLHDGISTFTRSVDGTAVIEQAITTYKTNSAGAADTAYQDVNVPLLLGYLRYDWRNYIARKYQNWKLGDDGATGAKVMTPATMKAEAVVWFKTHAENGLVENFDDFKKNLKVERNASNRNRLDVLLPPDLMNKLDVVATQIAFVR